MPRLAPGAVGASQLADAVYAADPRRGHRRRIRPRRHREALAHGRPGGRGTPSPRNKLPRWLSRVLHFTRVLSIGREEAFREQRIGRPVGGWRRALGGGREGSSSPERLLGAYSCPRRRKRDGHAVDRPRRIPDTRRSAGWPSPPATGALYFADINSPNSVVEIDPDIGDEVGECASQLPIIYPSYQSALSNGRSVVDSECGQKAPSPSSGIIRAPSTGPSSTELSSSRCIPSRATPPTIPTSSPLWRALTRPRRCSSIGPIASTIRS